MRRSAQEFGNTACATTFNCGRLPLCLVWSVHVCTPGAVGCPSSEISAKLTIASPALMRTQRLSRPQAQPKRNQKTKIRHYRCRETMKEVRYPRLAGWRGYRFRLSRYDLPRGMQGRTISETAEISFSEYERSQSLPVARNQTATHLPPAHEHLYD